MARFLEDTRITPAPRAGDDATRQHYRANLSSDWEVWGPNGGYVSAIAMLALGADSTLPRPATFHCSFLRVGRFEAVDLEVITIKPGRRAEARRVVMSQQGKPLLEATAWFVAEDMDGLQFLDARVPEVLPPAEVPTFEERVDNYPEWYPYWRSVQGKPIGWRDEEVPVAGDPVCQFWMRCRDTPPLQSVVEEAARMVLWMDLIPWNAVCGAQTFPTSHLAPNLDLTVQFHQFRPKSEWTLLDGHAPIGSEGLCGTTGRLFSEDGTLLASGGSQLICTPNPELAAAT